jgi:hypothetical protein
MRSRLLGRLVTGPLAFLVAGVVDVVTLWGAWGARSLADALRRRTAR